MVKTIIAFLAGLAVAALALSFLGRTGSTPTPTSEIADTSNAETASADQYAAPDEPVTSTGPGQRDEENATADESVPNERPPPELPIALPPEFAFLAEPEHRLSPHHRLEREPYDPEWAPAMEAQITQFLVESPEIATTYGSPTLTCRATACEVAFVAYGLDPALGLDADDEWLRDAGLPDAEIQRFGIGNHFGALVSEFFEQLEFEQFALNGQPTANIRTENGVTTLMWYLIDRQRD